MADRTIYEALADAFVAEGTNTLFVLTGDGNMHWEVAMGRHPDMHSIHVRHEHTAVAMATAYAMATGDVGVASVTCGPGLTQIMTALSTATQARAPLVVFAGEDPMHANWYNQRIDQAPLVVGTGAAYIAARSPKVIDHCVMEAFTIARTERRPVVLAVPLDLQKQPAIASTYVPSRERVPEAGPRMPHPDYVRRAVERIRAAKRVVVLAGRGAVAGKAKDACVRLADLTQGALTTTLPARGLFSGHPRDVGVAGGYAHVATRDALQAADLVVAVGASLSQYTSDQNALFKPAGVLQIDADPIILKQGQVPAGSYLVADAALALDAINAALEHDTRAPDAAWDVPALARRVWTESPDPTPYPVPEGTLDPRDVAVALSKHTNPQWAHVSSSGHCSFFATHLAGRSPENFLTIREFGAIGNGLSFAIGRWASRPDQPVMLTEGDGGLMMHIQELETVAREGMKILICCLNDGAFGSEIHKLRADGLTDEGAVYGHGYLPGIARAFGLKAHTITKLDDIPRLAKEFEEGDGAVLWDVRISDQVIAPTMRRQTAKR